MSSGATKISSTTASSTRGVQEPPASDDDSPGDEIMQRALARRERLDEIAEHQKRDQTPA